MYTISCPPYMYRYEQYVEDAYVEYLKQHNRPDEVSCCR